GASNHDGESRTSRRSNAQSPGARLPRGGRASVRIPFYLTIEGVDAVGKTTLASAMQDYYKTSGTRAVIKPEFPTAREIAAPIDDALRHSIFVSEGFAGGPAGAFFFMAYAEMTAMTNVPTADVIVGDRGLDSVCLYQGACLCPRDRFDAV